MAEQTPCRSIGHRTSQRPGKKPAPLHAGAGLLHGLSGAQLQDLLHPLQVVLIVHVDLPERRVVDWDSAAQLQRYCKLSGRRRAREVRSFAS